MKENHDEIIKLVNECYEEARGAWLDFYSELEEDYRFYLSDQWSSADRAMVEKKGAPALNLNYIKKTIDLVSGYERQNKSDIKILPIEGSDEFVADILTRVAKWIMLGGNNEYIASQSFKDALIGGLGFLEINVNYDRDPINGDIYLKKISPFDILIDPYFSESDLSDADYIIHHKKVSKSKLKITYPDKADKIEALGGGINSDDIIQTIDIPSDRKEKVLVVDYWYKKYISTPFLVNTRNGDVTQFDGTNEELQAILEGETIYKVIRKKIPHVFLATVVDKQLCLFHGENNRVGREYPFIPIFCFHESSIGDQKLKIQGLVRSLKDAQREKNKRRSAIMQAINTMPHSGFMVPKNSVDDINVLRNSAGAGKIIQYNPQKGAPTPIIPPQLPTSIMQLEMLFNDDIKMIGANPDLLGNQQGKNDPGITIQLRQKQGLTSLQEVFDSYSYAKRLLGRTLIHLIGENFGNEKIKRIVGSELPFDSQRLQTYEQIQALKEQIGQLQPPTTAGLIPEDADDEIMLQNIENQRLAVENQKQAMQNEIVRLEKSFAIIDQEEKEFWEKFDEIRTTARFDTTVDETVNNPTSRIADLSSLIQSAQYGVPVPPEAIIELLDVNKNLKGKLLQYVKEQQMMMQVPQKPPTQS